MLAGTVHTRSAKTDEERFSVDRPARGFRLTPRGSGAFIQAVAPESHSRFRGEKPSFRFAKSFRAPRSRVA